MQNINVLVRTCPIKYNRFQNFLNLDEVNINQFKKNDKAIMFVNDEPNHLKYKDFLKDQNFILVDKIDRSRFNFDSSPLYISKYKPNIFKIFIYKYKIE